MTRSELEVKLQAIREALIDAGAALMAVKEEEVDPEVLINVDDADAGLGLLHEAWVAAELGTADEYIAAALSRFERHERGAA